MDDLDETQRLLLFEMVEADRRVPRDKRQAFYGVQTIGGPGFQLIHSGWLDKGRRVPASDLQELVSSGALRSEVMARGQSNFSITSKGFKMYESLRLEEEEPAKRIEDLSRCYLDAAAFKSRHAKAYSKWTEAEQLLWAVDSEKNLTVIGHLCRESMREFANSLGTGLKVPNFPVDPEKTVDRLRTVLASRKDARGVTDTAFDNALVMYWGTLSDLIQRQEHGSQREGRPLQWNDARRSVMHLMIVMHEIDLSTR